jgi:hypothetical protein
MLDQRSLKNLQPPDMPNQRIGGGMLMALESIFGQVTSRHFRADEANQELRTLTR